MPLGDVHYADDYQPDFGIPWVPRIADDVLRTWPIEKLAQYVQARKNAEAMAENNPVGAGWTLPMWQKVMANWKKYPVIVLLGGNRSSKSTLASRLTLWAAANIPQAEVRCWHTTEDRSIEDMQRMIYDALPIGIKNIPTKKGVNHSLQYSQKNGFTDNVCILPPLAGARRGGQIKFGNYRQYQQDAQVVEGFKMHLGWGDEEMPQKMFETLLYRTVDYHGRLILSFTTLTGWTPLIQDILGKTRTLEKRFAPLVGRELPIVQESLSRPGCVIYYMWTQDNQFIDTRDFLLKIKARPKDEILARAYGIPTKSISGAFPSFSKEVHVVKHEDIPFIKDKSYPVARYFGVDPAGRKRWFMLWVAIDSADTWWVYREWPDESYGDWALPGNTADGKAGPAQKGTGQGIKEYVELILGLEAGERIIDRFIDPRLGAAQRQAEEGATTLISDLDDAGMTMIPAPGGGSEGRGEIEDGIQLINNLLNWDETKPRSSTNSPRIFISDRCQNLISALAEYTGQGTKDENFKDPIDVLRFLRKGNCEFLIPDDFNPKQRTGCY